MSDPSGYQSDSTAVDLAKLLERNGTSAGGLCAFAALSSSDLGGTRRIVRPRPTSTRISSITLRKAETTLCRCRTADLPKSSRALLDMKLKAQRACVRSAEKSVSFDLKNLCRRRTTSSTCWICSTRRSSRRDSAKKQHRGALRGIVWHRESGSSYT